jgi:hypothetical protein
MHSHKKASPATTSEQDTTGSATPVTSGRDVEPISAELQNPFDTLQILAKIAVNEDDPSNKIGVCRTPVSDCAIQNGTMPSLW